VPELGLVINHSFLWPNETNRGQEEGSKDRPCAIVLKTEGAVGELKILVVPVTRSPLTDLSRAVKMLEVAKTRLELSGHGFK
jgi:hypothetical protein